MQTLAHGLHAVAPLLAVTKPEDIEYLVKESEVLTGRPGRLFVIAGADRLIYRVQWRPTGFKVERLDPDSSVTSVRHLLAWEFADHSLVDALEAGQLFTPAVSRTR